MASLSKRIVANGCFICNNRALQVIIYFILLLKYNGEKSGKKTIFHKLNWTKVRN